jgi:hypothetical protein
MRQETTMMSHASGMTSDAALATCSYRYRAKEVNDGALAHSGHRLADQRACVRRQRQVGVQPAEDGQVIGRRRLAIGYQAPEPRT